MWDNCGFLPPKGLESLAQGSGHRLETSKCPVISARHLAGVLPTQLAT